MKILAVGISTLVLLLGVPTRFKYYWQGSKVHRRQSARDVSRKFYLVSWVVYILQVLHNIFERDWIDVVFWSVGVFTVGYCIVMCKKYWHRSMRFWPWVLDSFRDKEEGGFWK